MQGFARNEMKQNRYRLLYAIAVLGCLALFVFACSYQEDKTLSRQTKKTQKGLSLNQKSRVKSSSSSKTTPVQFSGTTKPETETGSEDVSRIEVSLEPGNPVTGDRLKAEIKSIKAPEDQAPLTYIWNINGERVQESADPSLSESIKCGDFVELQVGLVDSPQNYVAVTSTFIGNAPPTVTLASQSLDQKGLYLAQLEVSDPEEDQVTLLLTDSPTGMQIDASSKTIHWTVGPDQQGAFDVAVSAKDSRGAETLLTYQIKVARE